MTERPARAFIPPWPVFGLIAILIAAFAAQRRVGVDRAVSLYGFIPTDLINGRFDTIVLSIFLDGGWLLVAVSAAFALVFATPVSRRMGGDATGAVVFFVFFVACGILGNLGYVFMDPGSGNPSVGASGAIAGMMGAASRLIGRKGELAPFRSPLVIVMAAIWLIANLLYRVLAAGWTPIAWQAHLAGYAAGLFLISPALSLIGRLQLDHGIEN